MTWFSKEEIEKAREMDLLTYLSAEEPENLRRKGNNTYTTLEHDSLIISNGAWMWFSRGIGGYSALDYLIKVKNNTFIEAMNILTKQELSKAPVFKCNEQPKKKLLLPEANDNNNVVIKYLMRRGIDKEVINYFIDTGQIYESLPYHNLVMVGYDKDNVPRFASFRATNKSRILGDCAGSDKNYSFCHMGVDAKAIHIFESAIDLMSFATLKKRNHVDWKSLNLLSMSGVYMPKNRIEDSKLPSSLVRVLRENPMIKEVRLHLDNDIAGRKASLAIGELLKNEFVVINEPPLSGKDFNDYLQIVRGGEAR